MLESIISASLSFALLTTMNFYILLTGPKYFIWKSIKSIKLTALVLLIIRSPLLLNTLKILKAFPLSFT